MLNKWKPDLHLCPQINWWEPQSFCQLPQVINLCVFFQGLCAISAATSSPHHISPTRFSVKVMMCIISSFLSFKRKKMILVDLCFLQVESLCVLPAAYRIKPTPSSMMYKIFQTLVPPYTVSFHFPQCSCHWASKSSTNTPSSCNIQFSLSLKAFPTSAPRVSVILSVILSQPEGSHLCKPCLPPPGKPCAPFNDSTKLCSYLLMTLISFYYFFTCISLPLDYNNFFNHMNCCVSTKSFYKAWLVIDIQEITSNHQI